MKIAYYTEIAPELRQRSWDPSCIPDQWELIFPSMEEKLSDVQADWLISDFWFEEIKTRIPKERRILLMTEPDDILPLSAKFLNEFGYILSPSPIKGFKGTHVNAPPCFPCTMDIDPCSMVHHPTLTWSRDELLHLPIPEKSKEISVICSNKSTAPGQTQRKQFVQELKALLGERLDVYGRGINFIEKKSDAILPYKYHIVLENCFNQPGWWTEKLSDAYWGYSFPIYIGNEHVEHGFPKGSMLVLDISDPLQAVKKIVDLLNSHSYEQLLPLIQKARYILADKWHPMYFIIPIITKEEKNSSRATLLKKPYIVSNMRAARQKTFLQYCRCSGGIIKHHLLRVLKKTYVSGKGWFYKQ